MAALPSGSKNTGNTFYKAPDGSLYIDERPYIQDSERVARYSELAGAASPTAPFNNRTTATAYTLPNSNLVNWLTFIGAAVGTWTAAVVSNSTNFTWYIKNASSFNLVVNTAGATNDFVPINNTTPVNTFTLLPGNAIIIHNDGVALQLQ